ncbi:hypothetical protein [Candidatus Harpocratesius sp.]
MVGKSQKNSSGYTSVVGILMKVSDPRTIQSSIHLGVSDVYLFGMKTINGERIMFSASTRQLGWFGDQKNSIVYWWNDSRKCELKTSIKNIERYIGTKIRVVGVLETIDASSQKYRLINVKKIVLFLE